jgi:hypothetical protein
MTSGRLIGRWPTGLALIAIGGVFAVITLVGREAEYFGPSVAVMAGIYLVAYALGRPWTAWPAFLGLSVVMGVLHAVSSRGVDPGVAMTLLLVPLWLWAVARRRYTDVGTFTLQTAGMVVFGLITLVCAAVQPEAGAAVAGVGFLAHGAWDAYHFAVDKVVNRPWSEFCGVIDLVTGTALLIVAAT